MNYRGYGGWIMNIRDLGTWWHWLNTAIFGVRQIPAT